MLWAYCPHHEAGYYFFDVRIRVDKPVKGTPTGCGEDMRKVRGLCMFCGKRSILFVGVDELTEHRYRPSELCACGLPPYHQNPSPQFLQEYNARPVPCRNGRANV